MFRKTLYKNLILSSKQKINEKNMKQTKTLAIIAMAGALLATSCASKKELQNCQTENKELTGNYQAAKEQLAASQARELCALITLLLRPRAESVDNLPNEKSLFSISPIPSCSL